MSGLRVAIAGGGIGGLTAALCLAKNGHEVEVFEQAAEFAEIGAGIQLSPNCTRVLHHLGLEERLSESVFYPKATQFRDWKSGRTIAERPLGDTVVNRYGYPYYHIHRADLLATLVTAAQESGQISLHTNTRVTDCDQTDVSADLTLDSHSGTYDLLIGADGIHSVVRAKLWGGAKPTFTGNVAWRALVPTDQLPQGLVRPMSTAWWGPHRHFVHYYVGGGTLVNCVCVIEKEGWEVESWTEPGDYAELKADFHGWHDNIQTLIDTADPNSLYKWALFDRPPMPQWGKGRITLLGDACHPTLPFMAQGAAMAIEDGAVLAGCLALDGEVPDLLQHYEALRKERTAGIQLGSRGNASMFHLTGIKAWQRNRRMAKGGDVFSDELLGYDALSAATS